MLKLLIRSRGRHQQTFPVSSQVSTRAPGLQSIKTTYPAVNLPTILVPAIVVLQIGMTSCNSASNTLSRRQQPFRPFFLSLCSMRTRPSIPVEVLARANGSKGVRIRQCRKDTNSKDSLLVSTLRVLSGGTLGMSCRQGRAPRGRPSAQCGATETYSFEFSNCARTAMI